MPDESKPAPADPATISVRLAARSDRGCWRSLEELADASEMDCVCDKPSQAPALWDAPVDRRTVLKLMAASIALAAGCGRQPKEEIVPYVRAPEQVVPGRPLYFATALTLGGYAQGVLVESHLGRPTKVEGNPQHPASLGATDAFAQAAVLGLYDPDRSQALLEQGRISGWERFLLTIAEKRAELDRRQGEGLYVLTETVTSPTLGWQLAALLDAYPQAHWHQYDPAGRDGARLGAQLAFGASVETLLRLERAKVIVSLDGDFLGCGPARVRYARELADGRRGRSGEAAMSRLYVIESTPTLTGAMADHRVTVPASRIEAVARILAGKLGLAAAVPEGGASVDEAWLTAAVEDLQNHRGASLVVAGDHQPAAVHALVQAMNERLENFGATVIHTEPVEASPVDQGRSLRELVVAMEAGEVDTLLILDGNPAYAAPADLKFAEQLQRVPLSIHWGLYADETASRCRWHVPAAHELEAWGDARAYDGTVTVLQPLIAPLYQGRSAYEVVALLQGEVNPSGYDIVRAYWRERYGTADFETFWRSALHDGVVAGTAAPVRQVAVREDLAQALPAPAPEPGQGLELQFRPDPTVWDGRYANNGWLQELPKPLTKLTWDNAALVSPATAARLALGNEDVVELAYRGRTLHVPVWITPGQAEESVTLTLGYGRTQAGRVGDGRGSNAYQLRTADAPWFGAGVRIQRTGERWRLASTQHHHGLHGRDLVRVLTREAFERTPAALPVREAPPAASMYPPYPYEGYAWAMVVDLNACTGCSACVAACQAENNVPVVGKEEVLRGREMHWLRIDRYYAGDPESPRTYFQPVPCMQCELAPCEPVCPVGASVHDAEGINDQVYNRCVGTRYCQANCPYKVRRFNFFDYSTARATNEGAESVKAVRNPDVTVRSRGVMEKCTYCIQRISAARIAAEEDNRRIRDGEVVTACQQACPTRAIHFGDLNDPESRIRTLRAQPHHYALLAELNTRPRTTYLARLLNPNPDIDHG